MVRKNTESTPDQTSPGSTRSAPDTEVSGCSGEKWATGTKSTRRKWTQEDNRCVMACYYQSQPEIRGYRKRMHAIWREQYGETGVSEQRLQDQKRTIIKNKLLSPLELQQLQTITKSNSQRKIPSTPEESPSAQTPGTNRERSAPPLQLIQLSQNQQEVKEAIEKLMLTWSQQEQRLPTKRLRNSKELRENLQLVNEVIQHIQTDTITATNNLTYAAAIYIEEQVQPRKPRKGKGSIPPWKKRLRNKIKSYRKDISQLSSAQFSSGR